MLGGRILVVEDDDAIRSVLREVLVEDGYSVETAIHGQDALDYLLQAQELPDLILLDPMLPTMSGSEFRAMLRQHQALHHIPIVVLSAVYDRLDLHQCVALDAVAYLQKPINWPQLMTTVARWCPSVQLHVASQPSKHVRMR